LQLSPSIVEESIHAAAAIGHSEVVRQHLDTDPQLLIMEADGWQPIVYACASRFHALTERHAAGIAECVTLFLDRGADPKASSAMRRAIMAGNRSAALILYQRGAGPGAPRTPDEGIKEAFWGIPDDHAALDKALADLFQDGAIV